MQRVPLMLVAAIASLVLAAGTTASALASPAPTLAWSPTTSPGGYTFTATPYGETSWTAFELRITKGSLKGAVTVALTGSSDFQITSDGCSGRVLKAKAPCTVTVEFTALELLGGATLIATAAGSSATARLDLDGDATPHPLLTWSEATVDMGTVEYIEGGIAAAEHLFTLGNHSTTDAIQLVITIDGGFGTSGTTCTGSLRAGEECTYTVLFEALQPWSSYVGTLTAVAFETPAATATVRANTGIVVVCIPGDPACEP